MAISAIQGMGGIGKTELALQYAYRSLEPDHYPGGVCWLRSREDVGIQIVNFARIHLDLSLPTDLDLSQQVAYCWSHWRAGTTLLIWDDVSDYEAILPYLPPGGDRFKVLLTTRLDLGASVRQLRLEVLSQEAALDLLRSIVSAERIDAQLEDGKALCEWVGCLPLGLELVARYLARKEDLAIATLLQRLQDKRLDAKALKQTEPGMTAALGVAAAFELSWQDLPEPAQLLAGMLSLFAPAPIPWSLVEACFAEDYAETLTDLRDEALIDRHLLQRTDEAIYQLHPLVREFFAAKRQEMSIARAVRPAESWVQRILQRLRLIKRRQITLDEEMKRSVCRVLVNAVEYIPQALTLDLVAQFTPLIPHLVEVTTHLSDWLTDEDLITPYLQIARFYQEQAAYEQAQPWLTQACTVAETRLGANHADTASSLNNLALLYDTTGRYSEAEPLYLRAVAILFDRLGETHPNTQTVWGNFIELLKGAIQAGQTAQLSDHPETQRVLEQLQKER